MNRARWMMVALAAASLAALVWQRSAMTALQQQNEKLRGAKLEAERLEQENVDLPTLRASAASASSPADLAELPRLRNEVRQFRQQRVELDRLKEANRQLEAEIRAGAVGDRSLKSTPGFLARDTWANAGFATPEAALETFLWSARSRELGLIAACLPEKDRGSVLALTLPENQAERDKFLADLQQMTDGEGIRVVDKVVLEQGRLEGNPATSLPTKVQIRVQAVAGGAMLPLIFRLNPDGWKIREF